MKAHILETHRFSTIYLGPQKFEDIEQQYPTFTDDNQEGLYIMAVYARRNNKKDVSLVAIEYKDACGVRLYMDCFKIEGLVENSDNKMWLNINHLVKQVIYCRENNIDLNNITSI